MLPIIFEASGGALFTYTFLLSVAFFVAMILWIKEGKRRQIPADKIISLSLETLPFIFIGARGLFIISNWSLFSSGRYQWWALWQGGIVFYGGFLSGLAYLVFRLKKAKISVKDALDTLAPGLAFAHAVGRLGCFANGCCHGKICDLPWAVSFTHADSAASRLGVPVHPSQLYEAGALLILGFVLLRNNRKPFKFASQSGSTTRLYLASYAILRFFIEFSRGDTLRGYWGAFSTSQWVAIMVLIATVLLDFSARRPHKTKHNEN